MRLSALSLSLAAVAFAGAGLAFLAAPGLLVLVDLAPVTATARSDVRAVFGGSSWVSARGWPSARGALPGTRRRSSPRP